MAQLPTSGIKLFRAFGIQVYLHWSWFIIFVISLQARGNHYTSQAWNIAEYLSLFVIVLMHEFGHALACRSVGGQADRILLWPFGGVAFVNPPPRPGAVLWSIVAGPLVNVILIPITIGWLFYLGMGIELFDQLPNGDLQRFAFALFEINLSLLIFNMLPIYPLDGGQILRAVLWFVIGARRSLLVATAIGLVGAAGGIIFSLSIHNSWLVIMAGFAAMQSWAGFQRARQMSDMPATGVSIQSIQCPTCGVTPPAGPFWTCACGKSFDVFANKGVCPQCGGVFAMIPCPACQTPASPADWFKRNSPSPATPI